MKRYDNPQGDDKATTQVSGVWGGTWKPLTRRRCGSSSDIAIVPAIRVSLLWQPYGYRYCGRDTSIATVAMLRVPLLWQ